MINQRNLISSAGVVALLLAASAAFAAEDQRDPILPPEPGAPGQPSPSCAGWAGDVTVDPSRPRTGANYHTISAAICAAKDGAHIEVSARPGRPYREQLLILKPLTISSAFGDTVTVASPRSRCASVRAKTEISGFHFLQAQDSFGPCLDLQSELILTNVRIDVARRGVGILLAPRARLAFKGSLYDRHGVFAPAALNEGTPIGIHADVGSSVTLEDITVSASNGVVSRASTNTFVNVDFKENSTAITLTDDAADAGNSPNLTIQGGAIRNNVEGIRLFAGSSGRGPNRFRGQVAISGSEQEPLKIEFNRRAIEVDTLGPSNLSISHAAFNGNAIALRLPIPVGAKVDVSNSTFAMNSQALSLNGPLDGMLSFTGGSIDTQDGFVGIYVDRGQGTLKATLNSVSGPSISLGAEFLERFQPPESAERSVINVSEGADPAFLTISLQSSLCQAGWEGDWSSFTAQLKELNVKVGGRPYWELFGKRLGRKARQEAYDTVCRP
jgi:hypothetical protein